MGNLFCDDCGAPAVGRFDITYFRVEEGEEVPDEVSKVVRGRALCAAHASVRGENAKPSTEKRQSELRVLPEVSSEQMEELKDRLREEIRAEMAAASKSPPSTGAKAPTTSKLT